jgi:hypothetical protein
MSDAKRAQRAPEDKEPLALSVPITGTALEVMDFGEDAGAGLEDMGMDEQLTPFLRMLQSNSPQLNRAKAEYVPGAAMGMILNTATGEAYEEVDVVVCAREHHYGQWIPRDLGTGFRGAVPPDDPLVRATLARMTARYGSSAKFKFPRYRDGKWTDDPPRTRDTDEAIELVETGQLYVLYGPAGDLTDATASRAILAFTSTSMPTYQSFLTRHANWKWRQPDGRMLPAALWMYRWRLKTLPDKNSKGEYFVWNLQLAPSPPEWVPRLDPVTGTTLPYTYRDAIIPVDDPVRKMGREFNALYRSGQVKVDYEAAAANEREPGSDDTPF